MSRLARRLFAGAVGTWLLFATATVSIIGYRVLDALVTDGALLSILVLAIVLTLVFGYLSYRFGTRRLLASLDAVPLPRSRAPTIHARLDRLTERMGIDRPALYAARLGEPNAFAPGGAGVLVIDRSLLRLLAPDELEAILAHELAHLEGHDSLVGTLAYSFLRTTVGLALFALVPVVLALVGVSWGLSLLVGRPLAGPRSVGFGLRRAAMRGVTTLLVAPTIVLRAYSRRREYAADDRAVSLIDDPLALARALRTIQRASEPGWGLFSWLLTPRERDRSPIERVFATHPPTDDRIERVRTTVETREREREHGRWHRIEVR